MSVWPQHLANKVPISFTNFSRLAGLRHMDAKGSKDSVAYAADQKLARPFRYRCPTRSERIEIGEVLTKFGLRLRGVRTHIRAVEQTGGFHIGQWSAPERCPCSSPMQSCCEQEFGFIPWKKFVLAQNLGRTLDWRQLFERRDVAFADVASIVSGDQPFLYVGRKIW